MINRDSKSRLVAATLSVFVFYRILQAAEEPYPFAQNYTKHEYRVPMRDGVKLFTLVYTPKDRSTNYPILLQRTPYDLKPYTIDFRGKPHGLPDSYLKERFIFAMQDVRGKFASEGVFEDVRPHKDTKGPRDTDESTDTYDTVDWLIRHVRGHNGAVGLQGISYLGFFAAAGMIDSHPALKAVSPQAPAVDLYGGDDVLHGGGFWLAHNFGFFAAFGQKVDEPTRQEPRPFDYHTPDGYQFFLQAGPLARMGDNLFKGGNPNWNEIIANVRNAKWCAERDLTPHLKNVRAAVLTVGGWFDAEDLHGTLKTYRSTEAFNPGIFNALVMGPWSHGQWHGGEGDALGPVKFQSKTSEFFRNEIEIPFFRRFLKGATNISLPEAWVFETGTDEWKQYSHWPPTNAANRTLWLQPKGRLGFELAGDSENAFFDEYVSDPARPVPFTERISPGMPATYMTEDQRFASRRPDVLVYQTDPLEEDVTLVGPVTASLHVSTSGTDSDWTVKLIDVYTPDHPDPDPNPAHLRMGGYQQLVRGEPLRGKLRKGLDHPEPFKPGEVTPVEWTLPDICHTFRSGHRIMIQIQSSWFPLLDLNPQTYCDIYEAGSGQFQKATQRVYTGKAHPSGLKVQVLSAAKQ
jgi:putative CocE/NonD family hydrolase